ncbi:MAG: helicase HerA-like domain-containing protein [Pseudomonadota bacterium]
MDLGEHKQGDTLESLFLGGGSDGKGRHLLLRYANRHGLIAGATGTGKTVTLQILTEAFSRAGCPVFLADVKGDLSGLAEPGTAAHKLHDKLLSRAGKIGLTPYDYEAAPTVFWDIFGEQGHPIRTTVSEMGPMLLARLLELNDTQEGVLAIAFRVAEDEGLALLDLKDLQALLTHIGEHAKALTLRYGRVSTASVGAIQRRLLMLETEGGAEFFGEPALVLSDMIAREADGRGRVNILAADKLIRSPRLYATFLLWLLSELFEELPEVGDPDKPKFVFFFDEAHLLFDRAPRALVDKVEQVARLIRSKGVGVYFVTQQPDDIPEDILGQLGNRIQHALRAYTPRERRALKQAAESFRPNPAFDTADAIRDVGIGEAVVSCLEEKGRPAMVDRVLIRPPSSHLGPCQPATRRAAIAGSPLAGRYDDALDRVSAFELLSERAAQRERDEARQAEMEARREAEERRWKEEERSRRSTSRRGRSRQSVLERELSRAVSTAGRQIGRSLVRSLVRGLFR